MAEADSERPPSADPASGDRGPPAIVLVDPQLGENIGMVARAMLNCGLADLRLVRPRDGWPNDKARSAAAGAAEVVGRARLFETTAAAVADLQRLYAATARRRDMVKPTVTPRRAALEMRELAAAGGRCGVLFGPEAKGLNNDDVALADAALTVPLNPRFTSLNLAQAVLVVGYEWCQAGRSAADRELLLPATRPATKAELIGLFEHLERELDLSGFLSLKEKRPIMARNLRNLLGRAELTEQEVRTLRGVIASLSTRRRGGDG